MTSSNSTGAANSAGLKEFGDGDAALFNGNGVLELGLQQHQHHQEQIESQEDFEEELHRLLTDTINTNNLEMSNETILYDTFTFDDTLTNSNILTPQYTQTQVKFEEDPLSTVLNYEQQQSVKAEAPRKRGRPPLIKFKTVTVHKPTSLAVGQQGEQCHLQLRDRRSDTDFYSPVWIRGRGVEREGLCPLCEPAVWLKIKQSAYWYHMNFFHGISAATNRPYKRPISYRYSSELTSFKVDGHCGNCLQWIQLVTDYTGDRTTESVERTICFTTWFKHAQKCHYRTREFQIPKDF